MYLLFQSSQITVPLWAVIVGPLLPVIGVIVVGWWARKRRSSVRAEDDRNAAETRNLEIQSIRDLSRELRDTRHDVVVMAEEARKRAEEHRKQQEFAREQILWNEAVSTSAREAAHAAINEIQRCVWAIQLRDEAIKEAGIAVDIPPFVQTAHKDIVKYQEFPLPPKRLEE
jgi:FtsZ-interacting cell division protein ZipA